MYALGVMYVPVIVGGVPHTVEWYHTHEVDPDLLQLDAFDTVDEWPVKEIEDFERQLWPLGMWFDYIEENRGPWRAREGGNTTHSGDVLNTNETNDDAGDGKEFDTIAINTVYCPSDEHSDREGMENVLGGDRLQAKDGDGYANPLDVYRRLARKPKVKTAVLDALIAPSADAHMVVVEEGEERIQCGLSREIKAGRWVPLLEGRCGATTTTLESYRRHLIQCHLDAGRMEGRTQGEVLEIRLKELIAQAVGAGLSVDAITPMAKTRKRRRDDDQDSREETESEEDGSDDVDFLPKRGRSARKRPRIALKSCTPVIGVAGVNVAVSLGYAVDDGARIGDYPYRDGCSSRLPLVYMDDLTAIERSPVEIWSEIISLALETWLLPGSDDNVFDTILLFSVGCLTMLEYRRVETIRRHLRAVCRFWKEITDNHNICLTVTDFWRQTLPSELHLIYAKRIQTPLISCHCQRCPGCFPKTVPKKGNPWKLLPNAVRELRTSTSLPKLENVRAVSSGWFKGDVTDHLQSAPRLTAFGGRLCVPWQEKERQLHGVFKRLTHLEIRTIASKSVMIRLDLPSLRSLHLHFRAYPSGVISVPIPIETWIFPRLVSFLAAGKIRREDNDELLRFILSLSHTLRNLIIDYCFKERKGDRMFQIGVDFLQQEVCGGLDVVSAKGPPLGLSLLLVDMHHISSFDFDDLAVEARECVRLCQRPEAIFDKILIPLTWGQLLENLDAERVYNISDNVLRNIDPLQDISPFFEEIYKSDVVFLDRDGVELRQRDGLKLLKRLEVY
ncbi:hypothetical protein FRC17_002301, partial [Serendipita sp. 399]